MVNRLLLSISLFCLSSVSLLLRERPKQSDLHSVRPARGERRAVQTRSAIAGRPGGHLGRASHWQRYGQPCMHRTRQARLHGAVLESALGQQRSYGEVGPDRSRCEIRRHLPAQTIRHRKSLAARRQRRRTDHEFLSSRRRKRRRLLPGAAANSEMQQRSHRIAAGGRDHFS